MKLLLFSLLALPALGLAPAAPAEASQAGTSAGDVYVIPVKQTVQSGLASFLDRALTEAEEANASLVVLDIHTPGGELATAEDIGLRIVEAKVPTVAFVSGNAASAGAYLALNAGGIAMGPGSAIGAAMIVDVYRNAVENPKFVSFWKEKMRAAAQINGRNPDIAVGMVDPNEVVEMKELGRTKLKGQILSLTAQDALKVGYSDFNAASVEDVIAWKELSGRNVVELHPTLAERIAQFVTGPGISTLLLIVGIAGVAIELFVPGFGVPGIVGLLAFGLYFFGQSIAGFAGMESITFFMIGIILLLLEMFMPSFGILGILGIVGVVYGIASAAYDTGNTARSLGLAALVAFLVVAVVVYVFRKRGVWNRFILREELSTEKGYIPNAPRENFIGLEGTALSTLRPAGIADIGGQRLDVVTSGEYVDPGKPVRVVSVDGTRILVKEIKPQ